MNKHNPTPPPVASPAFESADIKTVREALEGAMQSDNESLYPGMSESTIENYEPIKAITRLSARQAAFEAMRLSLIHILDDAGYIFDYDPSDKPLVSGIKTDGGAFCHFHAEEAIKALALADAEMKGEK